MKHSEYLGLHSDNPIEPETILQLEQYLNARNIKVRFVDIGFSLQQVKDMLQKEGPTYIMSLEWLRESVLPVTDQKDTPSFDLLIEVLRDKLSSLSPTKSLTIVDNYLFANSIKDKSWYLRLFKDIVAPIIQKIELIRFITLPDYNVKLYEEIASLLKNMNPHIAITHSTSKVFHDRFWITDDQKGIFVGTSLNGIGKKYALVDNIRDSDTESIMTELKSLNLV